MLQSTVQVDFKTNTVYDGFFVALIKNIPNLNILQIKEQKGQHLICRDFTIQSNDPLDFVKFGQTISIAYNYETLMLVTKQTILNAVQDVTGEPTQVPDHINFNLKGEEFIDLVQDIVKQLMK